MWLLNKEFMLYIPETVLQKYRYYEEEQNQTKQWKNRQIFTVSLNQYGQYPCKIIFSFILLQYL
jgi:hypothetical protein